jgi:uncharacterized membrane protein
MQIRPRTWLLILGTCLVVLLFGLLKAAAPDGIERATLLQFFGRFHPLAVHLPIALLLLVPVLEMAAAIPNKFVANQEELRQSAGFVLGLAVIAAFVSAYLGTLLAWSGGYQGDLVTHHSWGGVWLPAAGLICWALRPGHRRGYCLALAGTLGLLIWTADQGGKLTHGETYLTEFLPASVQRWVNVEKDVSVDPASFYATRVQPIFNEKCTLCHNAGKFKGKLRLDGYSQAMRGGKDGRVIRPGDAAGSELIRRVTMPSQDKDFMPAEGKPALTQDEIKLIRIWIAAGATPQISEAALQQLPAAVRPMAPAEPFAPDYRPQAEAIAALESSLGVRLVPRSKIPTDGLILRTASAPERCTDQTLKQLAPLAALIVDAELSRTRVTDKGLAELAVFPNLRFLDLSRTDVTAAGVAELEKLPKLESLNLTQTRVKADGIAALENKPSLKHLYFFEAR